MGGSTCGCVTPESQTIVIIMGQIPKICGWGDLTEEVGEKGWRSGEGGRGGEDTFKEGEGTLL